MNLETRNRAESHIRKLMTENDIQTDPSSIMSYVTTFICHYTSAVVPNQEKIVENTLKILTFLNLQKMSVILVKEFLPKRMLGCPSVDEK